MPKKAKIPDPEPDMSKAWLDSYADAMTLMLAFFILLFAFSLVDEEKFTEFKFGVHQAFGKPAPTFEGGSGLLDRGNGVAASVAAPPVVRDDDAGAERVELDDVSEVSAADVEVLVQELSQRIQQMGAADLVGFELDPRGVIIRMDSKLLFRSGSPLILPDGVAVLDTVAAVLKRIDNQLVVEGHTDDVPTNGGAFPTNWELSTARAVNVLRFLSELGDVPAVRLSASGHAETRPLAVNNSAENRAINRRVELIVIVDGTRSAAVNELVEVLTPNITTFDPGVGSGVGINNVDLDGASNGQR